MGAALGGVPMQAYLFNDPDQAADLFGAGTPLADAIRFAFMGGVNGGASAVIGVRVDNAGQAYGALAAQNGGAGLSAVFNDYGAYGNSYSVSFYPGSASGTMAVIQGTQLNGVPYLQKIDNETSFSRLIDRINAESPVTVSITSGGTAASQTLQLATSQVDGRATVTGSQGQVRSNQAYIYQYPASMLANTTDSMVVSFNSAISWSISSINATTDVFTTPTNTLTDGNTVRFTGATLPAPVVAGTTYVVRDTTATTFTLAAPVTTPEVFSVSAFTAASDTFTALGNTFADGDVVQVSGTTIPAELSRGRNYFVVNKSGDDFKLALTRGGTAIDCTGTISAMNATKVAGGLLDISGSVSGARVQLWFSSTTISASTPSDFNGTRTAVRTIDTYNQTLTNAAVTASAYSSDTARITLQGSDTWGHLNKLGYPGSIFTIASGVYTGTYEVLHQEWDGLGIDKVRIVRKLTGDRIIQPGTLSSAIAWFPQVHFGRLQPATTAMETVLPANGLLAAGGQYLTVVVGDKTAYYSTIPGDTIQTVADALSNQINTDTTFPVVASNIYNPATFTATITLLAKKPGTTANSTPVSILVNVQSTLLVSAGGTLLAGGAEPNPPRNAQGVTSGSVILGNGYDSTPTYQRWLDGLEAIKYTPVRWLVPAGTDNIGVQIAFADHCALMSSTPRRRERVCILGHGFGWSLAQIRARAEIFQSERVIFCSPGFTTSDGTTGNTRLYPASYMAAVVAGILAAEGNGITDPITHTYLKNIVSLEKVYQPGSIELDQMINSGVLTIERDPSLTRVNRGYRVTRAITTWRVTTNSALKSNAFESISVVNQSDFIAATIREMEESLFIGGGIYEETLEAVRLAINAELLRQKTSRVIYGFDAKFTQVSLSSESPNALLATYKFYPVPSLEFILNTQILAPIPAATA
jgi:hypothetical protein